MRRILLSGSSGLLGTALWHPLKTAGYEPIRLVRDKVLEDDADVAWNTSTSRFELNKMEGLHGVIHLAGAPIAGKKWTPTYKQQLYDSRIDSTRTLAKALAALKQKPEWMISASALGFYGDQGAHWVDESTPAGDDFLATICRDWEQAADPAREAGIRVIHPRIGLVLSRKGGALAQMLPLFKAGLGGHVGTGKQYMSWIHLSDLVDAFLFLMKTGRGAYNLSSPHPVTNREFTRVLGKVLHRPTLLPAPAFALRMMLGEMADALLLSSTRARPAALQKEGFEYQFETLDISLADLLA